MKYKIGTDEVLFIKMFGMVTGAEARDCIINEDRVTFIVSEGDIGQAIGRKGSNIKKVEEKLNKKVDVIEFSQDPLQFVRNLLHPIKPKTVYLAEKSTGEKVVNVEVERRDKNMIMGSSRRVFNRLKMFLSRYHGISNIEVQ